MAEKDITEKILMGYNDIFSDIINVLLFNGTERVQPDSLEDKSSISQYKASDNKVHEEERDVFKLWKDGKLGLPIGHSYYQKTSPQCRLSPLSCILGQIIGRLPKRSMS